MSTREVTQVVTAHRQREGAGFIVRRPFPGTKLEHADPFLLLDEMGPIDYAPGEAVGAPDHPHRGFETVTYVIEGEGQHEDSAGHRGVIRAGDVQWMTAGRGVIHSEEPSDALKTKGGRMHGFQLWVNLPSRDKMIAPRYQEIPRETLPTATSSDGLATVKVIAGSALGVSAAIETRTPIAYHHWTLRPGARVTSALPPEMKAYVYVFRGTVSVAGREVTEGQLAVLGAGDAFSLESAGGGEALLLAGVPLREPIAWHGPFVMNTRTEILDTIRDYQEGRFGEIDRSV
jgi:quercetin 2,3-dioxygenase